MRIGLIAGSGQFPIIFCERARQHGFGIYAVAYLNEAIERVTAEVEQVPEVVHLIEFIKSSERGITR